MEPYFLLREVALGYNKQAPQLRLLPAAREVPARRQTVCEVHSQHPGDTVAVKLHQTYLATADLVAAGPDLFWALVVGVEVTLAPQITTSLLQVVADSAVTVEIYQAQQQVPFLALLQAGVVYLTVETAMPLAQGGAGLVVQVVAVALVVEV